MNRYIMKLSKNYLYLTICIITLFPTLQLHAGENPIFVTGTNETGSFPLVKSNYAVDLVVDSLDAEVVTIAANALSQDIKLITGIAPEVTNQLNGNQAVIIGTLGQSKLIDSLVGLGKISTENIVGQWETFCLTVVDNPLDGLENALVIFGSDPRGTAFGVFEFSKLMGVSPWVYWADVLPEERSELYVTSGTNIVGPPSIQYRGIFINDEDWGLQPWAARHIDTDIEDIGPNTYEKVFELMLRVKANYLWPAMHPCTKAFWYYPENPVLAKKYEIVLGSSHAEPMLRNNVDEWKNNFIEEYGVAPGDFNWATNRSQIETYWTDRAIGSKDNDALYTVGMRGIHDSKMEGYNTDAERAVATKEVINVQRDILSTNLGKSASEIPQVFCPYKEALVLYRLGLDLADDITLLWVDDNFGYIRQLSNPQEQTRSGGSGVYFHFSYWGVPQDYLWLSTISPSLTCFEMSKAYALNAKKVWIYNIGDIKPNEMEMQFGLDMAWDVTKWTNDNANQYSAHWASETFGENFGERIGKIKQKFYHLAASGKPEHLHAVSYTNEEMEYRLSEYQKLVAASKAIQAQIPARLQDAYFELIAYPIEAAASMNEKIFYARQSHILAAQGNKEALALSTKSNDAYQNIVNLTRKYNKEIASGKWDGMMDYAPRGLSHFYASSVANEASINENALPPAESDVVTVLPANNYTSKNEAGYSINTIEGLGISDSSITVWPLNLTTYTESTITSAPYVEYNLPVVTGMNKISVKCLPSFPLYSGLKLRYAISIAGAPPTFFNMETSAETSNWSKNLLQGFVSGQSTYVSDSDKEISVRIYFSDPGLVVSAIAVINSKVNELTKRITNWDFEYISEDVLNDGSTLRVKPYGWLQNGTILGNSYGINNEGTNISGNNLCWYNSTPMPNEFELYQIIDTLPAGEYIVRCRLAVMSGTFSNQRLFANNCVQYFGGQESYISNLTDGEINTFAGWPPSTSYQVKEMAVKVPIYQGDPLKLGIRSSNKKSNGTAATDNSGWFKVDYFRLELLRLFGEIEVEKARLDSLIHVASALYDTTNEGSFQGNYPTDSRNALKSAINSATAVSQNSTSQIKDFISEIAAIEKAIADYKNSVVIFTSYILNPNFEYKSEGVLNDGSTVRGVPYGWKFNGTLIGDSYGINNDGVYYSGNNLCWINSTPMPDDFELYQIIENLPPGEYCVKCLLAVMDNGVSTQRLFANNNVQYFESEADYGSNLTEGEINTFADWETSFSYLLKEMSVHVTINSGDSLKMGIRSGNMFDDGSRATSTNAGWFKVDNFRLEQISSQETPVTEIYTEKPFIKIINTDGGFYLNIENEYNTGNIMLYSINGNLILRKQLTDLTTFIGLENPGMYILNVSIDEKVATAKVIFY